jgi:hypothetical protein
MSNKPIWISAAALMLRISHILFKQSGDMGTMAIDCPRFNAWATFRATAIRYMANRSVELEPALQVELDHALFFAHTEVHAGFPGRSIEECDCAMASEQRELALLLAEEAVPQ